MALRPNDTITATAAGGECGVWAATPAGHETATARAGSAKLAAVEPELARDAAILAVLALLLLAARVPVRWVAVILLIAVGLTLLLEAFISELTSSG
jgi:hypothetical protein